MVSEDNTTGTAKAGRDARTAEAAELPAIAAAPSAAGGGSGTISGSPFGGDEYSGPDVSKPGTICALILGLGGFHVCVRQIGDPDARPVDIGYIPYTSETLLRTALECRTRIHDRFSIFHSRAFLPEQVLYRGRIDDDVPENRLRDTALASASNTLGIPRAELDIAFSAGLDPRAYVVCEIDSIREATQQLRSLMLQLTCICAHGPTPEDPPAIFSRLPHDGTIPPEEIFTAPPLRSGGSFEFEDTGARTLIAGNTPAFRRETTPSADLDINDNRTLFDDLPDPTPVEALPYASADGAGNSVLVLQTGPGPYGEIVHDVAVQCLVRTGRTPLRSGAPRSNRAADWQAFGDRLATTLSIARLDPSQAEMMSVALRASDATSVPARVLHVVAADTPDFPPESKGQTYVAIARKSPKPNRADVVALPPLPEPVFSVLSDGGVPHDELISLPLTILRKRTGLQEVDLGEIRKLYSNWIRLARETLRPLLD